jgi:transcription factor C subunit 6
MPVQRASGKDNASKTQKNSTALTIGAWRPEVGIHCVSWCKSIRRAGLLASGSASGLVRIDFVSAVE